MFFYSVAEKLIDIPSFKLWIREEELYVVE